MEPLQWVFVLTALTLIFIVFATNPLQLAINEAIQGDAQLQAQRFASIINIMSTAPDGTIYTFDMPTSKCSVKITDSFVRLTITPAVGGKINYTVSLIKTPTEIINKEFECKTRFIEMRKEFGLLKIF